MIGPTCPCGSGVAYDACCGPLHHGGRQASTAVELMRSRYSAYTLGLADYVFRTWHPRTRPATLDLVGGPEWSGLTIKKGEKSDLPSVWIDTVSIVLPD